MAHPLLRYRDGYEDTSHSLRDDVKAMQTLLNERGFRVEADGYFGPGTQSAVQAFQRAHELEDDGVVGPLTWAALEGEAPPAEPALDFPTTFPMNHHGLTAELAAAADYRDLAQAAADAYDVPIFVLAGIASRESGWGLRLVPPGPGGIGDRTPRAPKPPIRPTPLPPDRPGFGRGIMQIDYDAHEFARTGKWADAAANLRYGAGVLAQNRRYLARTVSLVGVPLLRAALSAYNCGAGNTVAAIRRRLDVDFFTTGRDYARDTLNRAGWFRARGWE